ncbi:MAG: hypothetical protein AAF789_07025 [Bacteroidota bacterium]
MLRKKIALLVILLAALGLRTATLATFAEKDDQNEISEDVVANRSSQASFGTEIDTSSE